MNREGGSDPGTSPHGSNLRIRQRGQRKGRDREGRGADPGRLAKWRNLRRTRARLIATTVAPITRATIHGKGFMEVGAFLSRVQSGGARPERCDLDDLAALPGA